MSDESDPPRLSKNDGSEPERRLAALVAVSQRDVGTRDQVARLETRLLPLIGPPLPPGAAPTHVTPTAKLASLGVGKLVAASAVVATVATTAYVMHTRTPSPPPAMTSVAKAPPVEAPPSPPPPAPAENAPAPSIVEPAPAAPPPVVREKAPPSEAELVGQAQAAVSSNPGRALALCEQHARLYPRGVLVQEREVLAIEALQQLGRHSQAVLRGQRFLKAFPGSAHQSKIAAIVGPR